MQQQSNDDQEEEEEEGRTKQARKRRVRIRKLVAKCKKIGESMSCISTTICKKQ